MSRRDYYCASHVSRQMGQAEAIKYPPLSRSSEISVGCGRIAKVLVISYRWGGLNRKQQHAIALCSLHYVPEVEQHNSLAGVQSGLPASLVYELPA